MRPTLFRPPYGNSNDMVRRIAAECGYKAVVLWKGSTNDGKLTMQDVTLHPGDIKIAADGTLSTREGQLAQIGVFNFSAEDMKKLQRAGNTAFVPMLGAAPVPMDNARLKQGVLESSNVNAVEEMVNMQNVSRAYESSIRMMKSLEDLESRAIRNLTVQ